MAEQQISYTDGAAYERIMGKWSQLAGKSFIEWLAPSPNLSWIDVGCGNGAFTELLVQRCAPRSITGVDPADAQLAYGRSRPAGRSAKFQKGDAMALPSPDASFDVAVMALVIFFVPDPSKGVSEMVRVVKAGGLVAAYAWDMMNGGFPFNTIQVQMREMGIPPTYPPSVEVSRIEALRGLWVGAGLDSVETTEYSVHRTYDDFEDLWASSTLTASVAPKFKAMALADVEVLKARMRACFPADASGRITCSARVTAVKGRVPK
jgi:SAM-dependent methyltransferase